jgi:hydrogenase nickel incorporation protein HypA/HybF
MDELEIARTVFETVIAETEKTGLRPIAAKVSYGSMAAVNREALQEAFASLCQGTACDEMRLDACEIPVRIRCNTCAAETDYSIASPCCGKCGSHDFTFMPEAPILLEEIEFRDK